MSKTLSKPIICIIGPTASGKSKLALELCRKNWFNKPEIISMDSAQIYKDIDIATAKPNKLEQAQFKHHLIDICDPKESYSVNRFIQDTLITIKNIKKKEGTPIIVGGTMMYFNRLLKGMHSVPKIPDHVRNQILEEGHRVGWPSLHKRLIKVDSDLADKISPFDAQRIQRGIEVWTYTGKSLSDWINLSKKQEKIFKLDCVFNTIALIPKDRSILHDKIKNRFNNMIKNGLIEEVMRLKTRGDLSPQLPSIKIVGVKQAWEYLDLNGNKDDLIFKSVAATRQLAKRQLTWIRSFENLQQIDSNNIDFDHVISICKPSF